MWAASPPIGLADEQRRVLEGWVRAPSTPQGLVLRSRIVLMASQGVANHAIAKAVGTSRPTIQLWRERFSQGGLKALTKIKKGRGRKSVIASEKVKEIIEATLHSKPPGATHWSCRTMAKAMGVSPDTVNRIWRAHELQPHRVTSFKLSSDRRFVEKLTDVIGLYLNPPEHALVLCVDEKSQIQALDRTQPGLPLKKGRYGTMTHDYKRHGTAALFAALNLLEGTVVGQIHLRHRHQEFLKFLARLDREFVKDLELHVILNNYGTHTHPKVKAWLAKHSRFQLHFIPTGSSWLNLIERWFAELTNKAIRRGSFASVGDLGVAIHEFLDASNRDPTIYVWTGSAETIMEKVARCQAILQTRH